MRATIDGKVWVVLGKSPDGKMIGLVAGKEKLLVPTNVAAAGVKLYGDDMQASAKRYDKLLADLGINPKHSDFAHPTAQSKQ